MHKSSKTKEEKRKEKRKDYVHSAALFTFEELFFLGIGICALITGTNTAFGSLVLGAATFTTLMISRGIVLLTARFSPTSERAYEVYAFVITSCIGTIAKMAIDRFLPNISNEIGNIAMWMIPLGIAFLLVSRSDDHNAKRAYTGDIVFSLVYWCVCLLLGIIKEFLVFGSVFNIKITNKVAFKGLDVIWFSILILGIVYAVIKSILLRTKLGKELIDEGADNVREH